MASLNFDTGVKTFDINGDPERTISFAPSDGAFVRRLYGSMETLDALQTKYQSKVINAADPTSLLDEVDAADKEVRAVVDAVFGAPVSNSVFGDMNCCGVASGMPVWANFLVAVIAECDAYVGAQEKAKNPKLEALLKKYKKK